MVIVTFLSLENQDIWPLTNSKKKSLHSLQMFAISGHQAIFLRDKASLNISKQKKNCENFANFGPMIFNFAM